MRNKQISYDSNISFTGGNKLISNLANGTSSNDAVNLSQLNAVQSLIENFEWQPSALGYIVDNTSTPPTEALGNRYILSHDGGEPNAAWDGASAGDIVEFDGSSWIAITPQLGTFISADDQPDRVYLWGGSSWAVKEFEQTNNLSELTIKLNYDYLDLEPIRERRGITAECTSTYYKDIFNDIINIKIYDSVVWAWCPLSHGDNTNKRI